MSINIDIFRSIRSEYGQEIAHNLENDPKSRRLMDNLYHKLGDLPHNLGDSVSISREIAIITDYAIGRCDGSPLLKKCLIGILDSARDKYYACVRGEQEMEERYRDPDYVRRIDAQDSRFCGG
jgi:hypothetical protein